VGIDEKLTRWGRGRGRTTAGMYSKGGGAFTFFQFFIQFS